ncbi:MAG: hypothetical protein M0P12_04150 [Paludibacteraceae bacterium]|nr:hypothetical protein [Paludibacteraceae bacterium]
MFLYQLYHPDKQPAEATAEEKADADSKFRFVNEAYNYLRKQRNFV